MSPDPLLTGGSGDETTRTNRLYSRAETNILVIRIFVSKCSIRICFQQLANRFKVHQLHTQ